MADLGQKRHAGKPANWVVIVVLTLLALGAAPAGARPRSEQAGALFVAVADAVDLERSAHPAVVRGRAVRVDLALLAGAEGAATPLRLDLFDDAVLTALPDRVVRDEQGDLIWLGHVEDVALSQVTLVLHGAILAGNVALPDHFYQVRYAGDDLHAVYEIDQAGFVDELAPIPVDLPRQGEAPSAPAAPADDGSVIDVLVVYTPAARVAAGGTGAIESQIGLAVAETNTSYASSGITQRLSLVHSAEMAYSESVDISIDLERLRNTGDGYMDAVHALRDTYQADEVVLLVSVPGNACGVAYVMSTVSPLFEAWAFAVVDIDCATGYYSFGHELGHNMGAQHDWYVNNSVSPYGHAHGYVNSGAGWRTVMAYNNECSYQGFNCTRLQYWSNPDVLYGGLPMGVPEGTSTTCSTGVLHPACDADNRKTLNKTAFTVANFRQGATPPPTPPGGLSATAVAQDRIDLVWQDNSGDETGFKIERSPDGVLAWSQIGLVGANVTTFSDGGLSAGLTYYYRVRAYNAAGDSEYSNVAQATTWSPPGSLVYAGYAVDDDVSGQSVGNGDGLVDCGEVIELYVDLENQGGSLISGTSASISTADPYVTWLYNTGSGYGDIPGGSTARNTDDFDAEIAPTTPYGHVIHFDLEVTATNGGPWTDGFDLAVRCGAAPVHSYLPLALKNLALGFDSQFTGAAEGWLPWAGTWWIDSGVWYTTDGVEGAWASSSYALEYADFDYQARLWRNGCDACASGLLVRGTPQPLGSGNRWQSGYAFYITRDSRYAVYKYAGGSPLELQPWTASAAINPGSVWNTLRVTAAGPDLQFYVNDNLLWAGNDDSYSRGLVGLTMFREAGSTTDQLWVDWAQLVPGIPTLAAELSPDQAVLNEAARRAPGDGADGLAPSGEP